MSYVQKILQPDEQLIYRASIHWIVYLRAAVMLVLGCAVLGWFYVERPPAGYTFYTMMVLGIGGLLVVGALFEAIRALIERHGTELAITSRRVIAKTGFIQRHTWEINTAKVEGVEVSQSVMGRILDYGTVTVKGTGGGTAPIRNIREPVVFRSHVTSL